jgi:hypothetical protein
VVLIGPPKGHKHAVIGGLIGAGAGVLIECIHRSQELDWEGRVIIGALGLSPLGAVVGHAFDF